MRRVVVTGMGIVSCLGNTREAVTDSLRHSKSGISFNEQFQEMGLRSQVSGAVDIDLVSLIDRKHKRFMGDAASYAYIALQRAIEDAGLDNEDVSNVRTGLIAGWGLTHTLPQLIGPGRSLDFLWSHRTIGGDEAARIGLVDRLFDDAVWEQELDTYIQQLVQLPQPAVHLTKLAVDQAATMDYTTMLSVEWESQQQCWASLETSEGLAAWRENRPPVLAVSIEDEEE